MNIYDMAAVITDNVNKTFPVTQNPRERQYLSLAEEIGEMTGAYRRYAGFARRTGTLDELADECADVLITTHVTAYTYGIPEQVLRRSIKPLVVPSPINPITCLKDIHHYLSRFCDIDTCEDSIDIVRDRVFYLDSILIAVRDFAGQVNIELEDHVIRKYNLIVTRGWREGAPVPS